MRRELGKWRPDAPELGNPGLLIANNCLPGPGYYRPMSAPAIVVEADFAGDAQGLFLGAQPAGGLLQFAAWDGHIYRVPGRVAAPVDVSEFDYGYTMLPGDRWATAQLRSLLLATNFNDPIQSFDTTTSAGTFETLSDDAPRARYIAIVRGFPVVAYTDDEEDGEVGYRVRWCGIDTDTGLVDPTIWTIGDSSTRADFRDIDDIGVISGITGGSFGSVVCEKGIARMSFGGSLVFSTDVVTSAIGSHAPGSIAQLDSITFFWGDGGVIYRFDGQSVAAINRGKNDRFLHRDIDLAWLGTVWARADPANGLIFWLYAGAGNNSGVPNRLLVYSLPDDEFTMCGIGVETLGTSLSFGRDLDDPDDFLDLDSSDLNLDDPRLWVSGAVRVGWQLGGQIGAFVGETLPATFETGDMELAPGRRCNLNRAQIYHQGGAATLRVGRRENINANLSVGARYEPQSDGWYRFRDCARYHRVRVLLSGEWQTASGLDLQAAPLGVR